MQAGKRQFVVQLISLFCGLIRVLWEHFHLCEIILTKLLMHFIRLQTDRASDSGLYSYKENL